MSALDFIKIFGYEGTPTEGIDAFEVFQGMGGGSLSTTGSGSKTTVTTPGIVADGADGIPGEVWQAQQRLITTCQRYLTRFLDVSNTCKDFDTIISNYIGLLDAFKDISPSWSAFGSQHAILQNLDPLWNLKDRDMSPKESQWVTDFETVGNEVNTWLGNSMDAQTSTMLAEAELADATTEEAIATAQAKVAAAKETEKAVVDGLPAILLPELPELIKGGSLLFAGEWEYLAAVVIRITLKIGLTYLTKWFERKLKLGDTDQANWQELVKAIQDLKYNDEELDFGPVRIYLRSKVVETPA